VNRFNELFRRNGAWALLLIWRLALNRLNLVIIRRLLGVNDIYFQGPPRILGSRFIRFGKNFRCGRGAWIEVVEGADERALRSPRISIGNNVVVSEYFHLAAVNSIRIGDDVLIGSGVLISDHSHGHYGRSGGSHPEVPPCARPLSSKGRIDIGRNVWIGDGVKILAGVTIGEGSVIGANTVVSADIPAASVCVSGATPRIVKTYDQEQQVWRTPV